MTEKQRRFRQDLRGVLTGGAVSALILLATILGVGRIGSFEALQLIEAALPSAHFLASAVVGGAITVLALLLTLLGLSLSSEYRFSDALYERARLLTTISVLTLVLGTGILLAVTVPVQEVEELANYYDAFYYVLAVAMSLLGGLVVAMGLLIGVTLRGLIAIGHSEGSSDLLDADPRDDEPENTPRAGGHGSEV